MIITLSRQYGAGARTVGKLLSERLGYHLLDDDLLDLVAKRLETHQEVVAGFDETTERFALRVLHSMSGWHPESVIGGAVEGVVTPDDVEQATHAVIAEFARRENLIVVGRGARWVVGDRPDALHVRLVAPREERIQRVMRKEGLERRAAERKIDDIDHRREAYLKRFFHANAADSSNYDLTLNTALFSAEGAAEVILHVFGACRQDRVQSAAV